MAREIHLSIRYLAEFLFRGGSIDSRFSGLDRGLQGSRIHRRIQRQGGPNYKAEVPLNIVLDSGGFTYHLTGRADGVVDRGDEGFLIDEIKTTAAPLELVDENTHAEHWAQGKFYAYILCQTRALAACAVQLTYVNIDTDEVKRFEQPFTEEELTAFVNGLLEQYHRWAELETGWAEKRNESLKALEFPFAEYREGQRKMAVACYQTYKEGGRLFCCAPTGIGKTMSSVFPAMKALGEGIGERIFYLTAKTITRKAAEDAVTLLRESSGKTLHFHSLTLTAKDKICFLEQCACNPEACPYANGYYDRVNDAVYEILQTSATLGRQTIEEMAQKSRLCPYELSLDLALWCDLVVGDYNYLFDPVVHLQRFFEGKGGDYLFLVDEAHNLVDRSREMYSARLRKSDFFEFKKALPKGYTRLHKALGGVNTAFVALRKRCDEENARVLNLAHLPEELAKPLEKFTAAAEAFLEDHKGTEHEDALLALYFDALFYQRISEGYNETYTTLIYRYGGDVVVKLFCLDPSGFLDESLGLGRASVLFSATLQPLPYYQKTLGGGEYSRRLTLESPFPRQNLGLFVANGVSTKYADRQHSLQDVADLLAAMVQGRQGNYIAYFPSYSYMQQVWEAFALSHPDIETTLQTSGMEEQAREAFIARFAAATGDTLLGFCVMGGIFGEGVDLPGDALVGTAIVGVGLPQMGPEPDAIRRYYDEENGCGFEYAYQYPGMNKVMQAAGRVIRTDTDKGVVLLIDSRFATPRYQEMFPQHWAHQQGTSLAALPAQLAEFWES